MTYSLMSTGTEMVTHGVSYLNQNLRSIPNYIDSRLEGQSPSLLLLAGATTLIGLNALAHYFQPNWGETRRDQMGRWLRKIPLVNEKYLQKINKLLVETQEKVRKKWETFGNLMTSIPEEGWSVEAIHKLISAYGKGTATKLEGQHVSGTIYSKNLDGYEEIEPIDFDEEAELKKVHDDASYATYISKKLRLIFRTAFEQSYLWNSLHGDEFSIGACMDYQVVRMVASMFGAAANEVMGYVTSGGTESLMLAVRAYRDWGAKNRGHQPGESVILASKNVHAAILKAGHASQVRVELIETDSSGRIDLEKLKEAIKKHGNKVVAIFGSAPCYPTGVIDPIEEMAKIAQENGCGMHVDCCLGGFIVNNIWKDHTMYLKIPGVTSLSADTHKNGLAAKGSSVLVTKELGLLNLAYYCIYAIPDWTGGLYGTPKDAGSQSCVQSFLALLAMLAIGKSGYQRIAKAIHESTIKLADILSEFKGKLKLVAQPEVNVVAFQIDEEWGLQKGATYEFTKQMKERGFTFNNLSDDRAHFCVTLRFAGDPKALEKFKKAVEESLEAVKKENETLLANGQKFSGDAGLYCDVAAAMAPKKEGTSWGKYFENFFFGPMGAKDAVRAYFLAHLDPFKQFATAA